MFAVLSPNRKLNTWREVYGMGICGVDNGTDEYQIVHGSSFVFAFKPGVLLVEIRKSNATHNLI